MGTARDIDGREEREREKICLIGGANNLVIYRLRLVLKFGVSIGSRGL